MCALKISHTNKDLSFRNPPERLIHTLLTQRLHPPHPSILLDVRAQVCFWKIFFGIVLRLKVTMGFNFVPSAIQPKATVYFAFSCPVVFTDTVFSPILLTVLFDGISNVIGVSSIFPMHVSANLFVCLRRITNLWKLVILSSSSLGKRWAILVLCLKTKSCLFMNCVHQQTLAVKYLILVCLANLSAFKRIAPLVTIEPSCLLSWTQSASVFQFPDVSPLSLYQHTFFGISNNLEFVFFPVPDKLFINSILSSSSRIVRIFSKWNDCKLELRSILISFAWHHTIF